jgi:hypothetical protein
MRLRILLFVAVLVLVLAQVSSHFAEGGERSSLALVPADIEQLLSS